MANNDFEIVDDNLRGRRTTIYQPAIDALIAGKTIRVPMDQNNASAQYSQRLKPLGYRSHTHATPEGTVVWAEKISKDKE